MIAPLLLGLLASLHCIGMCGPIAFALPVHQLSFTKKTASIIAYHSGRVITYTTLGLLFGSIGKGLFIAGLQQKLSIILGGILIIGVVFYYLRFSQHLISSKPNIYFSKLKNIFGYLLKTKTIYGFLLLGMLNGLLPCAMVYMALFGAVSTQGMLQGGMFMFWYGVGTIPLMTSMVWVGQWLNSKWKTRFQKSIPILLILMGGVLIIRGLGLDIPYVSPSTLQLFITGNPQCF